MARFYRTSNATPIDYMYRMNTPLMAQVLGANDQYIDQELDQSGKVGAFTFNYTPEDQDQANKIMNDYHNEADAITAAISKDPANWRKQQGNITDLTKRLQNDYINGDIGKYVSNYNARKQNFDNIDKQVALYQKTGGVDKNGNTVGIDPMTAQLAKRYADAQFKGTKNPDGTYNVYQGIPLMDNMDIAGKLGNIVSKMKEDGYSFTNDDITKGGQYFNSVTKSTTGVSPERILQVISDKIQDDPQLLNYLTQRQQIGQISGAVDSNGRLIKPFSVSPLPMSDDENKVIEDTKKNINSVKDPEVRQQLLNNLNNQVAQRKSQQQVDWNDNSYLAPIVRGVVNQYANSKTVQKNELRNNSLYNTMYTQNAENARQRASLAQSAYQFEQTQKGINDRFAETQAWEKYKFDNAPEKDGKDSKSKDKNASLANIPDKTGVSWLAFNQLNSLTVPSAFVPNKEVPLFSNEGLDSKIVATRKSVADIQSQLSDINKEINKGYSVVDMNAVMQHAALLEKKKELTKTLQDTNNDLYTAKQQYIQTRDAVMNNDPKAGTPLSKEDRDLYAEFEKNSDLNGDKFREYINRLKQENPSTVKTVRQNEGTRWATTVRQVTESPVVKAAEEKLQNFYDAKKRVFANKDTYLKNISNEVIKSNAITPNKEDGENIAKIFLDNPNGSVLLDANGDNITKNTFKVGGFLGFGSKDYSTSLEGNDTDKGLVDYIRNNGVKMIVSKVGSTSTAGRGTGAMKVYFDDPNGKLPKGVPFYVSLSDDAQKSMGNYFKNNKDDGVKSVAASLLDDDGNSIKQQIHANKAVISINMNGTQMPIYTHKLDNGHIIVYGKSNGKVIPFPRVKDSRGNPIGGVDGDFNNIDEFVKTKQYYEQMRANQK